MLIPLCNHRLNNSNAQLKGQMLEAMHKQGFATNLNILLGQAATETTSIACS